MTWQQETACKKQNPLKKNARYNKYYYYLSRIDGNGVIKVADFGLTEDMYGTNYFRRRQSVTGNEEKVPIRWMAPESIEENIYTEATDVVSERNTLKYLGGYPMGVSFSLLTGDPTTIKKNLLAAFMVLIIPQWSFGVTVWEIFTCGRIPYTGIPAMGLLKELQRGHRLERPDNEACQDEV